MDEVNIGTQINGSDSQRPHEGMLERRAWGGDLRKKKRRKRRKRKEKKTLSDYNCKMIVKLKVIHTYMYRVI